MTNNPQLLKIKDIIELHVGKGNQISSGDIGLQISIEEDATHVQVRTLIREAMEKLKIPIGAGSKGYYLIEDEKELYDYITSIEKRIEKIQFRNILVESAYKDYYSK